MTKDTSNRCLVRPGPSAGYIMFEMPTAHRPSPSSPVLVTMSKCDALVFAAWIVAIADDDGRFERIRAEVTK